MPESCQPNPEELKRLIEAQLDAATYIPLRNSLAPHLVEPYVQLLTWPYAKDEPQYPCLIIADLSLHQPGLKLAYSVHGHGSCGDVWGVVRPGDQSFGRDDSWFSGLVALRTRS